MGLAGSGAAVQERKGAAVQVRQRGGSDGAGLRGDSAGGRLVAQKRGGGGGGGGGGMAFEQVTDHEPPPFSFYKAASNQKAT